MFILLITLSGCASSDTGFQGEPQTYKPITGSVELSQSILLKTGVAVELELLELSNIESQPALIAKQIIKNPKRLPIQFSLRFDSDDILSYNRYVVRMRTYEGETLIFRGVDDIPVLTQDNPDTVSIRSQSVN
ncbi:MAG: YbaY family lipoprotein [Marichromatium sp.]|nr:YbaY family lipoprotein [Marichromatium sp.]